MKQLQNLLKNEYLQDFGSLKNPVSNLRRTRSGQKYAIIYAQDPRRNDSLVHILVSQEDLPQLEHCREVVIEPSGRCVVKDGKSRVSLGYQLYGEDPRQLRHLNGQPFDYRRHNIKVVQIKTPSALKMRSEGFWDHAFTGSTRALVSLCIKDNPRQSFEQLACYVAQMKNVSKDEALRHLRQFQQDGFLGYTGFDGQWREWTEA